MPPELIAWLVLGLLALVGLHEATHVLIARWHGHPTVCVAINPVGVAVVFEDTPRAHYWASQVLLPAAVTWVVCYVWLAVALSYPSQLHASVAIQATLERLPLLVTVLTVLTSAGDVVSGIMEVRRPVWGDERIHRGFRLLSKVPNVMLFTEHGRRRWQAHWAGAQVGRAASAAS